MSVVPSSQPLVGAAPRPDGILRLWRLLRSHPLSAACYVVAALLWGPDLVRWSVTEAVFTGDAASCRIAAGVCWAFIGEKSNIFLFGLYPQTELWRAQSALLLLVVAIAVSLVPVFWRRGLMAAWVGIAGLIAWLLIGGLGLTPVSPLQIGGLMLSLILSASSFALGVPLGTVLAIGRRHGGPVLGRGCVAFIETVRSIPTIALLFMASILAPQLLPAAIAPSKLVCALAVFLLASSVYCAEAIRGGMESVGEGQREAGRALGLSPALIVALIVIPQAMRSAVPSLGNIAVAFFKETTLVGIIGMYDFVGAIEVSSKDSAWLGFDMEGYAFAFAFYFFVCYLMTRYTLWIERSFSYKA